MKMLISICSKILGVSPGSLNYSEDSESNREGFRGIDTKLSSQKNTEASTSPKGEQEKEKIVCAMDWEN